MSGLHDDSARGAAGLPEPEPTSPDESIGEIQTGTLVSGTGAPSPDTRTVVARPDLWPGFGNGLAYLVVAWPADRNRGF